VKAVVYSEYGSPDVLQLQEVEKPAPKDNEVLVAVRAASVNSWDWDLLRGVPFPLRLRKPQYKTLGADIAGRVEAVGGNAKQFRLGEEVFGDISGCGWGGFAEYACVPENALALKSPGMTFEQAAAVPQAAVLALQGLRYNGRIRRGQKVLINGAGGGVGTFAVQLAKSFGAAVTGVDSREKLDMLRSIGTDEVIDYTQEDFTRNGQRYDLILDVVARRSISEYARALGPGGTCVIIGGSGAAVIRAILLGPWISLTTGKKIGLLIHRPDRKDLNLLTEFFQAGRFVPVVDRCYPLPEVSEALRYFGEGQAQGKVLITVNHD
jgi:NADPH:quinone reductase-like Zn-dependent oxidoreductase